MDTVQVAVRETYGVERIYPVCEIANIFTRLTRQKTFSHENIALIKQLGYTVIVVPQTVKEI
jgi:hypothetical protein